MVEVTDFIRQISGRQEIEKKYWIINKINLRYIIDPWAIIKTQ